MQLSIVIVNWNTCGLLKACLESIYKQAPQFDFEVIVVDNASNDFNEAEFKSTFPQIRFIANKNNQGYAAGNNQAIRETSGDFVLLLNPDTEIKNDALTKAVEFMKAHQEAAAVGCKLIRPDGSVDRSCRSFPEPGPVASEFFGLAKLFPKSKIFGAYRMTWFDYDKEIEVDQPMGSFLMTSRKAIDQIGLLDEDFPIFFNEVDWCYRAKQASWKIYFTPSCEIIHHGGASTKQVKPKMRRESHISLERFYQKHYRKKLFPLVYWFIVGSIRLSCAIKGR